MPLAPDHWSFLPAAQVVKEIPQQFQAQFSLDDQLAILTEAAVKLGLYDAADWLHNHR
jgi:regulator of sigma D